MIQVYRIGCKKSKKFHNVISFKKRSDFEEKIEDRHLQSVTFTLVKIKIDYFENKHNDY